MFELSELYVTVILKAEIKLEHRFKAILSNPISTTQKCKCLILSKFFFFFFLDSESNPSG